MPTPSARRILIIEDELHIAQGLKLNLKLQGYEVEIAADGHTGLKKWKDFAPHLIVLDMMMPGIDGLSVLRSIRLEDEQLPVLILSAKNAATDKVEGLSYGGDDYLAKPFHLEELLLRIERLLKRSSWNRAAGAPAGAASPAEEQVYTFGGNRIDFETGKAMCQCGEITLTEQEAKLLRLFLANPGQPLSRKALLEIGWGYTGRTFTRTVDNFMVRLRKYFEKDPKNPRFFKSLRSLGYVFSPEEEESF